MAAQCQQLKGSGHPSFDGDFSKKSIAVVTGAGRGIGRALVEVLHKRQYIVVPVVRSLAHLNELQALDPAHIFPIRCDITESSTEVVLKEFLQLHFPKVDLLINNAGFGATAYGIEALNYQELDAMLAVYCYSPIRCVKACLPLLRQSQSASIVNISSRFGSVEWVATGTVPPSESTYPYRIAKAAMNMLTACLSVELENENIRALSIHPGKVKTRFGPHDADLDPESVAQSVLDLIEKKSNANLFVNASSGEKIPW